MHIQPIGFIGRAKLSTILRLCKDFKLKTSFQIWRSSPTKPAVSRDKFAAKQFDAKLKRKYFSQLKTIALRTLLKKRKSVKTSRKTSIKWIPAKVKKSSSRCSSRSSHTRRNSSRSSHRVLYRKPKLHKKPKIDDLLKKIEKNKENLRHILKHLDN